MKVINRPKIFSPVLTSRYAMSLTAIASIAAIAILLYAPFLDNALVFDDHGLFSTLAVFDNAQTPFNFHPRTFPYFTFGWIQVEIGSIEAQRIVNLILHIFCALMLFLLIRALLEQALKQPPINPEKTRQKYYKIEFLALIAAIWFVINPVAVYGVGYLVQRTILFATLFSLLSLWFFRRAFDQDRTINIVAAAFFYSLAVFSKEHAILLPLAAIPFCMLYQGDYSVKIQRIALYLLLCLPAAVIITINLKSVIASSYEPYVGVLFSQIQGIPLLKNQWGQWFVSVTMQASFFFDYIAYWIFPNTHSMSIDMRINFTKLWAAWRLFPEVALFLCSPIIALYFVHKGRISTVFGCGLLYSWILFLTELTTIRFQEPFVLYRSYIWAPGYALMGIAVCSHIRAKQLAIVCAPTLALCGWLAMNRLDSLKDEYNAWNDAATKLESKAVVGAGRILYMRGRAYMKQKKYKEAIADFTDAIPHYPTAAENYYQRGTAYFYLNQLSKAQADFIQALALDPKHGRAEYGRGMVFERRGCIGEAVNAYSKSLKLGVVIAELKLNKISKIKHKAVTSCQF